MEQSELKYCSRCKTEKDRTEFYKNNSRKDGLQNFCKKCQRKVRLSAPRSIEAVENMRGGVKSKWLRSNRQFIIECLDTFGERFVIERFNLTHDTLDSLLKSGNNHQSLKLTKHDKALAMTEIALEGQKVIRLRMDKLESDYAQFTQAVGQVVGRQFEQAVSLGLQQAIKLPPALETTSKPDPLGLDKLIVSLADYLSDGK